MEEKEGEKEEDEARRGEGEARRRRAKEQRNKGRTKGETRGRGLFEFSPPKRENPEVYYKGGAMFRLPRLVARYTRVAASVAIAAGFATVAAPSCAPEAKEVKVAAASANPFAWITDIFGGGVNYSAVAQSIADILDNNDYDDGVRSSLLRGPSPRNCHFNCLLLRTTPHLPVCSPTVPSLFVLRGTRPARTLRRTAPAAPPVAACASPLRRTGVRLRRTTL